MPSHISITLDYDKQELLDMFNSSEKEPEGIAATKALLPAGVASSNTVKPLIEQFPFILDKDESVTIVQLNRFQRPHVNPENNGLVVFPVSGDVVLKTYSFVPNINEAGRRFINTASMTEEQEAAIESTLVETLTITRPTVIDGLTTYALGPSDGTAVVMAFKIPMSKSWGEVTQYMEDTFKEPIPMTVSVTL